MSFNPGILEDKAFLAALTQAVESGKGETYYMDGNGEEQKSDEFDVNVAVYQVLEVIKNYLG